MPVDKKLEFFSVDSQWLRQSGSLRLDASFYNPRVAHALDTLRKSGLTLARLGDVTQRVFIPPRFARTYVAKEHGIPFLQGSHIVHFQPADIKYISPTVHKQIDKWLIEKDWILVTRSGSVGRVTITPELWHGWAASEHIFRIVPQPQGVCPPGYLYAYLSSVIGQAQLTAQIYGAVVDELTEDQVKSVLVPIPKSKAEFEQVKKINDLAITSVKKRVEAVMLAENAVSQISSFIPPLKQAESTDTLEEIVETYNLKSQTKKSRR